MEADTRICCDLMVRSEGLGRAQAERFVRRMTAEERAAMVALAGRRPCGEALSQLLGRIADRQELENPPARSLN